MSFGRMRLFRLFSLSYLSHRPLKAAFTLLGMAVGIAVFVAIDLSNRGVLGSLERTLDETRGLSDVSVASTSGFLSDADYPRILGIPGTLAATPVLEVSAFCPGREDRSLTVLGIDPLTRGAFFSNTSGTGSGSLFLSVMEGRDRFLLPPSVAAECGVRDGEGISLIVAGRSVTAHALVPKPQGSWWVTSSLLFTDIATAQETFGRIGQLSRIEVLIDGGEAGLPDWSAAARPVLGEGLSLLKREDELDRGRKILKAFQINLLALGFVSIFVAVFIVYNSASLALLQRRSDLGNLRALGLTRFALAAIFGLETLLFGAASSLLGLGFGRVLAEAVFSRVLRTSGSLYHVQGGAELGLTGATVAIAFAIGLGGALLGALLPVWEAVSIAPIEVTRKLTYEKRFRRRPGFFIGLSALFFGAWIVLAILLKTSSTGLPHLSFVAALMSLLGFLTLTPFVLSLFAKIVLPAARGLKSAAVLVSCGQFLENPYRYGVVTAALSLGVALWLGVGLMVHSFRVSVTDWVNAAIRGDVYLILRDNPASGYASFLPDEFVSKVRGVPGIAHFDTLRSTPVSAGGTETVLSAIKLRRLMGAGVFRILEGDRSAFKAPPPEGEILAAVAESLATRMKLKTGDFFPVATPWGNWTLKVGAVLYDYSSERGLLYIDADDFVRRTGDQKISGIALFLEDPRRAGNVAKEIRGMDFPPSLEVNEGAGVRARVLRIFDETFQVTEALKYVAVFVAFLGILSTLSILFEQKRWELGLLAALGLSPAGLRRYGIAQGLILAAAGSLLGLAAGLALCWNIIHLIHKNFFGWTIFFDFDPTTVLASVTLTLLTGAVASFALISQFSRLRPAQALRYDE